MRKQLIKYRYILYTNFGRLLLFVRRPSTLLFYVNYYLLVPFRRRKTCKRSPAVTVVSYPKSGRTWLEALLYELAKLKHGVSSQEVTTLRELLDDYEDLPFVDFTHAGASWESHALTDDEIIAVPPERWIKGKVLFMWRDPKDTLVSSYFHLRYRTRIPWVTKQHLLGDPVVGIHKLINFLNVWFEYVEEHPSEAMMMRYEDLRADPVSVLEKICGFIGMDSPRAEIEAAVENTRFEKMQERERSLKSANPWVTPGDPQNPRSFKARKGTVGEAKTFFSADELESLNNLIQSHLRIPI